MHANPAGIPGCSRRGTSPALPEGRGGFTLLEVIIYLVVVVILFGPIMSVFLVSIRSNQENDLFNKVAERSRVAFNRIADEVRPALSDTIEVGSSGRFLDLTLPDGYDGAAIIPGARVRFEFQIAPDEQENGADDNGNGLVDEGQLVRQNLDTGETFSICQGIDLSNSRFEMNGNEVNVTIVNRGRFPDGRSMYSIDRTVTIRPRN